MGATSSTIKTIGMPFFEEIQIAHPQIAEPPRIADCLSFLHAAFTAEASALAGLKAYKQGLMQGLLPPESWPEPPRSPRH